MVSLYRRHKSSCSIKDKDILDACECQIWAYGKTDAGPVPRQSTWTTDLKTAQHRLNTILAEGKATEVYGPRLATCVTLYLASRDHELAHRTKAQYRLLLNTLTEFCAGRNIHFAQELTVDILETFKSLGLPGLKDTSKSTMVSKLRRFLKDAYRRDWIPKSLAEKVSAHRSVPSQKQPYTEEEVSEILAGAESLTHGSVGYAKHPKTFRLLLELMLATGLRAGDAALFTPAKLTRGKHFWVYRFTPQKTHKIAAPKFLKVYLTEELKTAIDSCAWLSEDRPFYYGSPANAWYLGNEIYERMQSVGKKTGVKDCRPHRLRDTFAVRLLLRGVPLEEVSRLLGHSSILVTQKHYAAWTAAREDRLEDILAKSLVDAGRD